MFSHGCTFKYICENGFKPFQESIACARGDWLGNAFCVKTNVQLGYKANRENEIGNQMRSERGLLDENANQLEQILDNTKIDDENSNRLNNKRQNENEKLSSNNKDEDTDSDTTMNERFNELKNINLSDTSFKNMES